MEGFTVYYLQQITVRIYWIIVAPTERSVKYFGFLGDVLDGSMLNFLSSMEIHNM